MKRHQQLQPLSRQHHNGLLASMLLKKGIKKAADPKEMAAFIIDFWQNDLEDHFKAEEDFLLPALAAIDFDTSLTNILKEEHALLRSYILSQKQNPNNISNIISFADLLEQHIRFEERKLFPAAEKSLSEDQLQQLGKHLHDGDEQNCINYHVKFWE
jgi:hemerythrin-like domain-containing protein